jgi:hypothetical protein
VTEKIHDVRIAGNMAKIHTRYTTSTFTAPLLYQPVWHFTKIGNMQPMTFFQPFSNIQGMALKAI